MKKICTFFSALFLTLFIIVPITAFAKDISISGTVYEKMVNGKESILWEATVKAIDQNKTPITNKAGQIISAQTDLNGRFQLTLPDNSQLEVSYNDPNAGTLESKIVSNTEIKKSPDNLNIVLEQVNTNSSQSPSTASPTPTNTPATITVHGTVLKDDNNGNQKLDFATIRVIDSSGRNTITTTTNNGNFTLTVPADATLTVSAKGYNTISNITPTPTLRISLEPEKTANTEKKQANKKQQPEQKPTTITVRGTVKDDVGPVYDANIAVIDSKGKPTGMGASTNFDGMFTLKDVPVNTKLRISYVGYITQTISPQETLNIELVAENTKLQEVVTKPTACTENQITELRNKYFATGGTWKNGKCVPTGCIQHYRINNDQCEKFECSQEDLNIAKAKQGTWDGNQCIPVCDEDEGYTINTQNECEKTKCSKDEKESIIKSGAKGAKWDRQLQKCLPSKCDEDNGYTENENNECVLTNCTKAQLQKLKQQQGVADGKLENGTCVPICKKNYHLNGSTCETNKCPTDVEDWDGQKCVKVRCAPDELAAINAKYGDWDAENGKCIATKCLDDKNFKLENGSCVANDCPTKELEKLRATAGYMKDGKCIPTACITDYKLENGACINKQKLEELQKAYDEAHAKEQSLENRALTAATTAATGIGTMELMQGMAEQSADKDAAADMAAYIQTMRCTYGDGKQVKAGPEEIELPGANDQELMNLRGQYLALAQDLKERKEALGMKPGIESEVIMDRASTGLYDDETIGITGGNYASLYRAQALKSEADQAKIDDAAAASKRRVTGGAIAAGAGVVGGIVGNQFINNNKSDKNDTDKEEANALKDLQKCLKRAGVQDTDKLEFANFYPSILNVKNINCATLTFKTVELMSAPDIFADSTDETKIYDSMNEYFYMETISKLVGASSTTDATKIKEKIKSSISEKQKKKNKAKDILSDVGQIIQNINPQQQQ